MNFESFNQNHENSAPLAPTPEQIDKAKRILEGSSLGNKGMEEIEKEENLGTIIATRSENPAERAQREQREAARQAAVAKELDNLANPAQRYTPGEDASANAEKFLKEREAKGSDVGSWTLQ